MAFIRDLDKAKKPISFDIETMNTTETVCYGLSNDAHSAMCINLRDGRDNRYSVAEERQLLLALQRLV